jgi:hypothetical protein
MQTLTVGRGGGEICPGKLHLVAFMTWRIKVFLRGGMSMPPVDIHAKKIHKNQLRRCFAGLMLGIGYHGAVLTGASSDSFIQWPVKVLLGVTP